MIDFITVFFEIFIHTLTVVTIIFLLRNINDKILEVRNGSN